MDILRTIYEEVITLENWLSNVMDSQDENTEYTDCIRELHNTYLAFVTTRKLFKPVSLSQHSHQHEIIMRTVQKLLKKKTPGQNVLTFGFTRISESSKAEIWQNIESRHPNSSVKVLQSAPWKKLLNWIGDELMLYILENMSVFIEVRPTCFVQLTGTPIYELWSFDKGSVLKLSRNNPVNHCVVPNKKKRRLEESQEPDCKRRKLSPLLSKNHVEDQMTQSDTENDVRKGESMETEDCVQQHVDLDNVGQTLVQADEKNLTFIPYNSRLILPRNRLLFKVNIRERIPKSACMMKHQPTPEGVLSLYKDIFINMEDETNNDRVTITPPSLQDVEAMLEEGDGDVNISTCTVDTNDNREILPDENDGTTIVRYVCTRENVFMSTSRGKTVCVGTFLKVLPLLKIFLKNVRRLPYKHLLNHHCPAHVKGNHSEKKQKFIKGYYKKRQPVISVAKLLNQHSHNRKVYLCMRACILHLLPLRLIGGKTNRNLILKKMSLLLSMGKYDKLSLGQLMTGLKTTNIDWLQDISSNSCRLYILSRLVHWLFVNVIFVLLGTMFYITDTTFLRYKLLYYRQTVWSRITVYGLTELMKRKTLKPMTKIRVQELLKNRESLGTSNLRFLPKQKSLRPIVNMGVVDSELAIKKMSINKQLTDLHLLLTHMKDRNQSLLGYGKLGTDEVYTSWRRFVEKWREIGQPKLYFVKTDISRCYDSILQQKLCEIMKKIFEEELGEQDMIITRYVTVTSRQGIINRRFPRKVFPLSEFDPDVEQHSVKVLGKQSNVIVVDKMCHGYETRENFLKLLKSHILTNIIKFGSKYYLHTEGISQGSVLSTLLCCFYYAEMEKKYFDVQDGEFMVRIVDDYMYVTPNKKNAANFLTRMLKGIPEYNCRTNTEKVCINFEYERNPNIQVLIDDRFPWCGMLFNTGDLSVSTDYDRYVGKSVTDTMSFDLTSHPGTALKDKLLYSVRQKCHNIFIDPVINSEQQTIRNIYHLFLFAVLQLHAFIRKLPHKQLGGVTYSLLQGIIKCLSNIVERKLRCGHNLQSLFGMQINRIIKWLCLHAFVIKFSSKKAQYSVHLKSINGWRSKLEKHMSKEKRQQLYDICGVTPPDKFSQMLCLHAFVIKFSSKKAQYSVHLKSINGWRSKLEKHMSKEKRQQLYDICGVTPPDKFSQMLT